MKHTYTVPPEASGNRLDFWLSQMAPEWSRTRYQQMIRDGHILLNQITPKSHATVHAGDEVQVQPPAPRPSPLEPEAIPLDILFEDAHLIFLNKPAGLVVHPAAGHEGGTLVNALLYHCADLAGIGGELRPGIVHRLDKDTSGVMVIAKTEAAMQSLGRQFKDRTVGKQYIALVRGLLEPESGEIETLIGRSPHNRKKMSARVERGRHAVTRYTTIEKFAAASCLRVHIKTGRTHQIRVHMAHLGHPILGDQEYGRAHTLADGTPVARQMLHAARLTMAHPLNGKELEFEAPLPADMRAIIQRLRG